MNTYANSSELYQVLSASRATTIMISGSILPLLKSPSNKALDTRTWICLMVIVEQVNQGHQRKNPGVGLGSFPMLQLDSYEIIFAQYNGR